MKKMISRQPLTDDITYEFWEFGNEWVYVPVHAVILPDGKVIAFDPDGKWLAAHESREQFVEGVNSTAFIELE